jgi:hypothetical protein
LEKQKKQAQESAKLKAAIESQSSKMSDMEAKVAQLTAALADAKAENKALATKLAANRTAATSVESIHAPRAPGSAVKANGGVRLMGSAETAQAIHVAQLKENLYSDLTGLIIRDVKREDGDDVYDCIQTGRNGSKWSQNVSGSELITNYQQLCTSSLPPEMRKVASPTMMRNASTFRNLIHAGTRW